MRKLEVELSGAKDQTSVWRTLLKNEENLTPFLCLTGLKRISKLINIGTPVPDADKVLRRKALSLVHEIVIKQPDRCDPTTSASILNYLKRVSFEQHEKLPPVLESYLVRNFVENIHLANRFSLGVFVASMVHDKNVLDGFDEAVWDKVNDRILSLKSEWNAKAALLLLRSLDVLDNSGIKPRPEVWEVLLGAFLASDASSNAQFHPHHYNVLLRRFSNETKTGRMTPFYTALLSEQLYGVLFNPRWRYVVEKMPRNFGEQVVDKKKVDHVLSSYLGTGKFKKVQIVHSIWAISKLGLPASEWTLSKLIQRAQDHYEEMTYQELALILRSLALIRNTFDTKEYHLLLAYISDQAAKFGAFDLFNVLQSVGMNNFHSESETVWKIIYLYLDRKRDQSRSKRDATILFAMGGLGEDSSKEEILRMCELCLADVDHFQNNELKWSLDGLARITSNHHIHEDFPEIHEQLNRRLFTSIEKKMDQWKLSSKQCAYLLDAIARSHSTIQTQLLERIVPELVVRLDVEREDEI